MKDIDNTRLHDLPREDWGIAWYELACRLAEELKGATTAGVVRLDEVITEVEEDWI